MSAFDDIIPSNLAGGDEAKRRAARAIGRNRRYLQIAAPTAAQVRDQTTELTRQMTLLLAALGGDVSQLPADPGPDERHAMSALFAILRLQLGRLDDTDG